MKIEISDKPREEFEVLLSGRSMKTFLVSALDSVHAKSLAMAQARGDSNLDESFVNTMEVESILKRKTLEDGSIRRTKEPT